jgi:transcription termination factor Rho
MSVLERSELEASPLADLHAIADQLGIDGFRRLRKAELIGTILGEPPQAASEPRKASTDGGRAARGASRRSRVSADQGSEDKGSADRDSADRDSADRDSEGRDLEDGDAGAEDEDGREARPRRRRSPRPRRSAASAKEETETKEAPAKRAPRAKGDGERAESEPAAARVAEGVVELLGNGSAFLRVSPPEPSDDDVYISAAQVRRCELVSGDRVTGPVRTPRRSERYPSLMRIDTINGASADAVSEGARYDDLPVAYPSDRLALDSKEPTLEAIEWLTPLGRGSRAVIVGASRAGKTETLRRLLDAVSGRDELEVTLVLAGARPEEISQWQEGPLAPVAALSLAASADSQGQAVERAIDAAKRIAARGGHALVLIDSLDGLHPQAARKALGAARNLREGGSLTVIATATRPFGGESTVIALDVALTSTGRQPILDLVNSGTLKPELLVGDDGAKAITQARAAALETVG